MLLLPYLIAFTGQRQMHSYAMGAVIVIDRPAVLNCDVVGRAEPYASAATDTGIASRERLCFEKERIEDWIH